MARQEAAGGRKRGAGVMSVVVVVMMVVLVGGEAGVMAWGKDGHYLVCAIAQTMFTEETLKAVNDLIPNGELADWCSWADQVRFKYRWSAPLHFIDTPHVCKFNYQRDCIYKGVEGICVAGAINNYTSQLSTSGSTSYNLTEALLFLGHFVGDIHQPLHVGYGDDKGGNTINVHWFGRKSNLHSVWDTHIIEEAVTSLYGRNLHAFQDNILKTITLALERELLECDFKQEVDAQSWGRCNKNQLACTDKYARESISDACKWAYEDAPAGSYLDDSYFNSRLPIVEQRIAHAGVRLASILNNIF